MLHVTVLFNVIHDIKEAIEGLPMFLVEEAIANKPMDPVPASQREAALGINSELDRAHTLHQFNEHRLEAFLCRVDTQVDQSNRLHWLLVARILEATIICAGQYADHAEYRLVGDLLINPRETHVHFADGSWTVKNRHDSMSNQFNHHSLEHLAFMKKFSRQACLNTVRPPLLPLLYRRILDSDTMSPEHKDNVYTRMEHLGKTMNFMWAWGLDGADDIFHFHTSATPEQWRLVEKNLCRFTPDLFFALGASVNRSCSGTHVTTLQKTGPLWPEQSMIQRRTIS